MQWITLLWLVPAILVPVVLLCGFAGCDPFDAAPDPDPPKAPSDLNANATGEHDVSLNWVNNATDAIKFSIHREGGSTGPKDFEATTPSHPDGDLEAGTIYTYTVKAVRGTGSTDVSAPSKPKAATTLPTAPSGLKAIPVEVDKIRLEWTNTSAQASQFFIHDHPTTGGVDNDPAVGATAGNPQTTDLLANPGTAHDYSVAASVQGFQNVDPATAPPLPVKSQSTPPVSARPLAFKTTLTTDEPGKEGSTIVQRFKPAILKNNGSKVKITVRASNTDKLTIDKITISQMATQTGANDPWDSAANPITVATNVSLLAGGRKDLEIPYNLDPTQDLLIAFDISSDPDSGNVIKAGLIGAEAYTLAIDPPEAGIPDRQDGTYDTEPDVIYLVEKIEVS